jgi:hypothetical protein
LHEYTRNSSVTLDPLTTPALRRRTSDTFPTGYLTIIAIIQGVALGIWVSSVIPLVLSTGDVAVRISIAGEGIAGFASILIVSYQYIWFSTVMRWTPTFLDTLVPYVLGVTEIVPAILIKSEFRWWVSMAVFLLAATAALVHTVFRSSARMFPGKPLPYREIRRLLIRLSICCTALMAGSSLTALLIGLSIAPSGFTAAMPWIITSVGPVMILLTERSLTAVYAAYGVSRR